MGADSISEHAHRWRDGGHGGGEGGHSQLDDDGARLDLVHFHEGKTFCAREPLLGLVVLEFKKDGCACGVCGDWVTLTVESY